MTEKEFDLVIHGSNEHVEALREAHTHQELTKEELRRQHGDTLDEFERVIRELDALNSELHTISEHAVQLDANFSKYGYSAHLRTRDSPSQSSANSLFDGSTDNESQDWDATRSQGQTLRFWRKPIIRQYFHKGLLWRAQEMQEVASYELFVDLLYVGILDIAGEAAAEYATGQTLHQFAIVFILGWRIWTDIGQLISWFDADDMFRRFTVLFILTCLLGFTTNMNASLEHTYTPLVAFYLAERLFVASYYAWNAYLIPMVRVAMYGFAVVTALPAALWIGSIHVHVPERYALIWIAIVLDLCSQFWIVAMYRWGGFSARMKAWFSEKIEFTPGLNIEHRIERTNAFVTLVFGYSVLALLYQNSAEFGINGFFGKAVLGLVQAFSFNWLYFELDSFNLHTHAIRRHYVSAILWQALHLPFILGYVISSSSLAKLVLAHDFADADYDSLEGHYHERSEEHILTGQRWFYCGGLALALVSMGGISLTHVYKTLPDQRLVKYKRVFLRCLVAIAILLLPLAESLNSLELIAITASLVVFVLAIELVGNSCASQSFFCRDRRECTYRAKCGMSRKEMADRVRKGEVVDVEEVARRDGGTRETVGPGF
ncbi:hypothetical protein EJ05DRAFT_442447 [Pseudovirgaria hyperparasitica]|uniref:Uncharacterized protein n=1 Tax=Pseudovirgaria hyperparasitica TaxID=470096 RepID=A0A6A6W2J0_9PEZI|nr:uncharacterized protein EJ05DRAFT_442447 [Pseudovirgaria hyperparasitica]KAF2755241.1 hypothetical protein EJ05DRAFT_442447 [Pseudovirgaria hyperparasitica]